MPRRSPRLANKREKLQASKRSRDTFEDSDYESEAQSSDNSEFEINNTVTDTDSLSDELAELDIYKCPTNSESNSNRSDTCAQSSEPPRKKRKCTAQNKPKKAKYRGGNKYSIKTGGGFSTKAKALQTLQFIKGREISYQRNMVKAFLCGAKSIIKRAKTDEKRRNINEAIEIFTQWIDNYELNKDKIDNFDHLNLATIKKYEILTDLYNMKQRKKEEMGLGFAIEEINIFEITKEYLKELSRFNGEIRALRTDMKSGSDVSWDIVRIQRLMEWKKELIKSDIRCEGTMKTIDSSLLYYKRGKLKGMPSRLHLQMIMYGYSPNKGLITRSAKDINRIVSDVKKGYI